MGEAADDIIMGRVCEICSCFFEEEHGYPVVCEGCWEAMPQEEKREHQKATEAAI